MTREHLIDGAKASPIAAYFAAYFSGLNLSTVATLLAAAYSLLLIIDKLRQMGAFHTLARWFARLHR